MRKYVKLTVAVCVIGVGINVLTAWGCGWWWQGIEGKKHGADWTFYGPYSFEKYGWWFEERGWKPRAGASSLIGITTATGYERIAPMEMDVDDQGRPTGRGIGWAGVRKRMGWPMLSMECEEWPVPDADEPRLVVVETRWGWRWSRERVVSGVKVVETKVIPLKPVWPGFAVNTMVYGGVLWAVFVMPGLVRWVWRKRKGRCMNCGYEMRGTVGGRCPECGSEWGME